ncbi:MAG: ribbon-helix-helix protein, CopG family [Thermofilum sp.]|nr:ribbon-helix-helix protein, CopG family [Thermofilum sp.]MCC6065169.1 ribbon-helix-helix protein, CopG family [Thermofilum sp.]
MPRPRVLRERGVIVHFYIERSYAEMLEQIAKREGRTVSSLLREVVIEWLEGEARVKYGLQLAAPPQVERASTAKLAPLAKKKLEDVENALKEVEPVVDRLAKKLPSLVEEAKRLSAEKRQVEEWRAQRATLRVGGREVSAEEYYWKWKAKADGMLKLMEGALREWKSARAKFFKVVYYPWLKYLRREVPADVMLEYEDRIAVILDKIDRAEPFARELEKLLHPERFQPRGRVGR